MKLQVFIKDYCYWYRTQAPVYGYFRTVFDAWFNARYFRRDGGYRTKTKGESNE